MRERGAARLKLRGLAARRWAVEVQAARARGCRRTCAARLELPIGDVDGEPFLTLGTEAVGEQRAVDLVDCRF
jgi:hypothetical protein